MKRIIGILLVGMTMAGMIGCSKKIELDNTPIEELTLKSGVLKVGVDLQTPPMSYLNEETVTPTGFDIDLAQELGKSLGLEIEFVDTAQENLLPSLDAKIYDCVISSTQITEENQKRYYVTQPYADLTEVSDKIENKQVTGPAGIFLSRSNGQLMLRLDNGLENLIQDGSVSDIWNKYFR